MDTLELMLARRSIRRYTAEDVSVADEERLLDAAFAAPSADNARSWHFVCVRDVAMRRRLSDLNPWVRMLATAPLVIAVLGRESANAWWIEDCSAAVENLLLEATALGLGAVWCGMREPLHEATGYEHACAEALGASPDEWRVAALVGVGHPAEHKSPRTQRDATKVSYETFGTHARRESR